MTEPINAFTMAQSQFDHVAKMLNLDPQISEMLRWPMVNGKESIARWLFGQVMREAKGQANPQVLQGELNRQLSARRQIDGQ